MAVKVVYCKCSLPKDIHCQADAGRTPRVPEGGHDYRPAVTVVVPLHRSGQAVTVLHCELSVPNKKLRDLRILACVLSLRWRRTVHELIEV